jgi:hypothetical protein
MVPFFLYIFINKVTGGSVTEGKIKDDPRCDPLARRYKVTYIGITVI